jgi:hypothetical protein
VKYCTDCEIEITDSDRYYLTEHGALLCSECILHLDEQDNEQFAFAMEGADNV